MSAPERYDVVILGGGLAGLSLARQLLLDGGAERTILLVDRREEIPGPHQKVGEATVQVSGYYISKVLDLEEHLFREHLMKYNLRFYWKSGGEGGARDHGAFEDYSQAYIQKLSNVASYQLDRNALEAELLARNLADERFRLVAPIARLAVELAEDGSPHRVAFDAGGSRREVLARWVVDASGRNRVLAKQLGLARPNPIHHGTSFLWVDGLVDVEKLTDRSRTERLQAPERRAIGHLPFWLATNHFCGEGFWLWVIPLRGKTSIGVVYDNRIFPRERVASAEALIDWACREFPLFARDLPDREVLHFSGFRSFSYDCAQTISARRWALTGEAGRFSDPLYSPGGDLIAIYNTLIADAVACDQEELEQKAPLYENLMRSVYEAYVPSFATSYDALGDAEAFSLKYVWELSIYFGFYVFPFLNGLFTDRRFAVLFLRLFSRLGPVNRGVQQLLSAFYQWKKEHRLPPAEPAFLDFMEVGTLAAAERTFYEMGVGVEGARRVLAGQLENLDELARFIAAHVASVVVGDPRVRTSRRFVDAIDPAALAFDPAGWRARWEEIAAGGAEADEPWTWSFDPRVMDRFAGAAREADARDEESRRELVEMGEMGEMAELVEVEEPAVAAG